MVVLVEVDIARHPKLALLAGLVAVVVALVFQLTFLAVLEFLVKEMLAVLVKL